MKYRKKPVVIEAVQWDGKLQTIEKLLEGSTCKSVEQDLCDPALVIETMEGKMRAEVGDWIIRGVKGELYPCKPDIFVATYESADIDLNSADFSDALMWLKEGERVQRAGWNGAGQYVILIPGEHLARSAGYGFGETIGEFTFGNCLAIKNAQNIMQLGWVPSMGDLMATDWQVA